MIAKGQSVGENVTPFDQALSLENPLRTPVAEFSAFKHETVQERWSQLIPLSKPEPGQQYAFEVDLDLCSGCKSCVVACHSLNGLDDDESWRDVGSIEANFHDAIYEQTITSACHHCADPGCLNGCPVEAYEKNPETGIVFHLDDQCIGCSYCILKCPYDVPKYNKRLGIVRKCDMCQSRLAEGEAPACAQACPTRAIKITVVDTVESQKRSDSGEFLVGAPTPEYTQPTTIYKSKRTVPSNALPTDASHPAKQHAHWPLIGMLVLTQISVGIWGAFALLPEVKMLMWASITAGLAGLTTSVLHLGQPLRAWRFFLGLRRSWLSREILVFSAFAGGFSTAAAISILGIFENLLPSVAAATTVLGLIGVFTSIMIYVDTTRSSWRLPLTSLRFFGSSLAVTGTALAFGTSASIFLVAPALILVAKTLLLLSESNTSNLRTSGRFNAFTEGPFRTHFLMSLIMVSATLISGAIWGDFWFVTAFVAMAAFDFVERYQFFTTVTVSKMPGGVSK